MILDMAFDMTNDRSTPLAAQVAIRRANSAYVQAFQAQNVARIAEQYSSRSHLVVAHSQLIVGQQAIRAFWQGVVDMGIYCAQRSTSEIQDNLRFTNEIGNYTLCRLQDEKIVDRGTYVALWQRLEERWQIRYEVWRSSWLDGA